MVNVEDLDETETENETEDVVA